MTELDRWFREALADTADRSAALDAAYVKMSNAHLLSKITLHTFVCNKGCGVLGRVVGVDGLILCNSRDFKVSPGKNAVESVESARRKRTLDGQRHWPSHTYDVRELAEWDGAARLRVACRHVQKDLLPSAVLELVDGVRPGHPGKPTRL